MSKYVLRFLVAVLFLGLIVANVSVFASEVKPAEEYVDAETMSPVLNAASSVKSRGLANGGDRFGSEYPSGTKKPVQMRYSVGGQSNFYYGSETNVPLPSGHGDMTVRIKNESLSFDLIVVMYDYSYSSSPIWNQYLDEHTMLLHGNTRDYFVGSNIDRMAVIGGNGLGTFWYYY